MSAVNRSESPITTKVKRSKAMVLAEDKIHRVRLSSAAVCTVANVVSPNCIWFKLKKDITENLQYVKPCALSKLVDKHGVPRQMKRFDYVMAPLQENIYARGRIVWLEKIAVQEFAYVHFIDEGFGTWMDVECMAVMEEPFFSQPWQAIPIALFKLFPGRDMDHLQTENQWHDNVTAALEKIMSDYEFFRVVPVQHSRKTNTYYEYARADIYGLTSEDDSEGESIGHRLALEMATYPQKGKAEVGLLCEYLQRASFDASQLKLLEPSLEKLTKEILAEIPRWRLQFPKSFDDGMKIMPAKSQDKKYVVEENGTTVTAQASVFHDPDWDPDTKEGTYPIIDTFTDICLSDGGYYEANNRRCRICVEWESVKSCYEFYAFPMKPDETMVNLYEQQHKWAGTLDSFYGHPSNRKPIDGAVVKNAFRNNQTVFGICECNDEVTSGSYRRVQIMAVRNPLSKDYSSEFCRIRFTDIGGNDIVPLAGLLTIHSMHCKNLPMCLQLCVHKINPPKNELRWSNESCRQFRRLARSDVPIRCTIASQVSVTTSSRYEDPPHKWDGVMNVEQLQVFGKHKTVEEEMCAEEKYAVYAN